MSVNIRNILCKMGNRLFVDENIKEMKDNVEKLMSNGSEGSEGNVHISKVLCDNEVIGDEYLINDSTHIHNGDVYNDVEFFTSMSQKTKTVFSSVHNCATSGGEAFSKRVYSKAISDTTLLEGRKKCLQRMEQIYLDNKEHVNGLLTILKKNEKHVGWFLEEKEESVKELYSMVFFRLKGLQPLNNVGSALTTYNMYRMIISPLFGIIAPIIYFVIPYLIVLYKFKVHIPFTTYIKTMFYAVFHSSDTLFGTHKLFKYLRIVSYMFSAAFYFQGIFTSVDIAKTVNKMSKLIITCFNSVIEYIEASNELLNMFWSDDHMSCYVNPTKTSPHSKETQDEYIETINKCKKDYSLFGNFGEQLKIYKNNNVSVMKQIVRKVCIIDALLGATRLKIEGNYTYAQFVKTSKHPQVQLLGMVHPCISREKAIQNDINLGYKEAPNVDINAIITSPNSSGKSILIKSILVNVLMLQSMGVGCCNIATITPFAFINTQINIPDSTGLESLFEAEMHRCKYTLDKLKELRDKNKGFTLTVMDEIFNSTNPIEAVAGGYAVCKKMASFSTNMLIFTTHFNYLTKLAKEPDCHFGNYKMETIVDSNTNDITFTYKLQRGVNKHMLALELLKKSGFEDEILDDAISIKNQLMTKTKA